MKQLGYWHLRSKIFFYTGIPQAILTHNPSVLSGSPCQPVQLTCAVKDLQSLNWYLDGEILYFYTYNDNHTFPRALYFGDGIQIEIISAVGNFNDTSGNFNDTSGLSGNFNDTSGLSGNFNGTSGLSGNFNGTSVLSSTLFTLENFEAIQCGNNETISELVDLTMISIQGIS